MVSINDIVKFTETFAPLSTQCEWDNSGLLVNTKRDIEKVLLCLDITKDVVEEAKRKIAGHVGYIGIANISKIVDKYFYLDS